MKLDHVSFSYGRQRVLDRVSLSLAPGQCMVVTGPNGSGKTTLLLLMAGALKPSAGTVSVPEKSGYVPQGTALFADMTVAYNIRFFAALSGSPVPETLPFSLDRYRTRRVSALSGGNQKRLSIACALLGEPELLFLDEPGAFLDLQVRDELMQAIRALKEAGKAVVLVSHDPAEFASFYDSILFLREGTCRLYSSADLERELGNGRDPLLMREKIKRSMDPASKSLEEKK